MSSARADISGVDFDVAVVGLGPVGAVAANLLAREGLSVFAVEPLREPYDKPRAIAIDHEALRVLQKLGIADELTQILGPYRATEYRARDGQVLRRIKPQPEPHPLSWPPNSTFIQPALEGLLRSSLGRWATLEALLGWSCTSVDQQTDHATLALRNENGGGERRVTSRYVVACDGASSPVREAMGLTLEDLDFDEPWLVLDMLVNEKADLPGVTVQYCDPARPCTFIEGPGNLRRWEIMLRPGEDPDEMQKPELMWPLLDRWLTPDQGEIWRAASYRFHALVCGQWRQGPVFLAGDAAHQTPPFMGQGMNQGIRDVANLCWKIGEVLKHGADQALLDSYEEERKPNVRAVIELTKELGKIICEQDPVSAARRDQRLLEDMRAGKGEIIRQDLLPPLSGGVLLAGADGGHAPGIGSMFPQPWVETDAGRRRMDDVIEARWLMVVEADWVPTSADRSLAERLGVTIAGVGDGMASDGVAGLRDASGMIADWMSRHSFTAVVVRPDHIVFGGTGGSGGESELLSALERAVHRLDVARTD